VWSAITDPSRLARWYGEVEGDLRLGGEFRARLFASGWEGTGRVEECEPPRHLMLLTKDPDQADEGVIEITLSADGDQTILVCEERSMPLHLLAAYGAGIQVHAEDLAAHLAGRQRCDPKARWDELIPAYRDLVPTSAGDRPGRHLLATASNDRTVRIWAAMGTPLGHGDQARSRSIRPRIVPLSTDLCTAGQLGVYRFTPGVPPR
jgi:uncharacterized protein YndB with AHSA1/START domain